MAVRAEEITAILKQQIEQFGIIGLQIHGGGKAEASYKDISLEEMP